jgi:hypothetical protein
MGDDVYPFNLPVRVFFQQIIALVVVPPGSAQRKILQGFPGDIVYDVPFIEAAEGRPFLEIIQVPTGNRIVAVAVDFYRISADAAVTGIEDDNENGKFPLIYEDRTAQEKTDTENGGKKGFNEPEILQFFLDIRHE